MSLAAEYLEPVEGTLRWIDDFAERVSARCRTRLYAGLAQLTAAYLDELRDLLAQLLDEPRATPEEIEQRLGPQGATKVEVAGPFVPGAEPSW